MQLLGLKLAVAPLLIGGATLAARRWGPAVGGMLVGLPLTSGPVTLFVAVEQGTPFAVEVGRAVLAGGFALCAFALVYAWAAVRSVQPAWVLGLASMTYVAAAAILGGIPLPSLWFLVPAVGLALVATLRLLPLTTPGRSSARAPRWDLAARIVVGTGLIVALTTLAPVLGPRASGLISTYPVYLTTLTVFAHLQSGPGAVAAMQRGLVVGLFGWLAFWTALLATLPTSGVALGFAAAVAAAIVVQGASLRIVDPPAIRAAHEVGDVVP